MAWRTAVHSAKRNCHSEEMQLSIERHQEVGVKKKFTGQWPLTLATDHKQSIGACYFLSSGCVQARGAARALHVEGLPMWEVVGKLTGVPSHFPHRPTRQHRDGRFFWCQLFTSVVLVVLTSLNVLLEICCQHSLLFSAELGTY